MTSVSIEREKLTAWEARMNTASTLLSATNSGAVIACLAGTIQSVGREIREELDAGTARNTAMKKQLNDAREELEKNITEHIEREEQHGDCQVCGKEPSAENPDIVDGLLTEEQKSARNGSVLWSPDEESVLRTFTSASDARERAYLPGRDAKSIDNKWRRLNSEHKIIDKKKPFRYIGDAESLKDKLGIIKSYTDDRKFVNADMQPDNKYCQIAIRNITQEGIL